MPTAAPTPTIAPDNAVRGAAALAGRTEAAAAGLQFDGDPWFAYGTELIAAGQAAWRESRAALDALPLASEMLAQVTAAVAAEQRRDFDIPVSALRMSPTDGRFYSGHPELQVLTANEHAWKQLVCGRARAPGAAASYLPTLPLPIVAAGVNHHLATARTNNGEVPRAMLRTKRVDGAPGRSIYAAVSPGFGRFDVDQVAAALAANVHPTARGKAVGVGARWELQAQFGLPVEPVVGDVFTAMLSITGADDGSRRLRVQVAMEQVRCVNLTRLPASVEIGDGVMHRGTGIAEKIGAAIAEGYTKIASFVERWADASQSRILFDLDLGAEQVFAVLLANGHIARPSGMTAEEFVGACVRAYQTAPEYGLTQRGVSYAVTLAAQQLSPWAAAEIEEQAGDLLYNYVVINPEAYRSAQSAAGDSALGKMLEID